MERGGEEKGWENGKELGGNGRIEGNYLVSK